MDSLNFIVYYVYSIRLYWFGNVGLRIDYLKKLRTVPGILQGRRRTEKPVAWIK